MKIVLILFLIILTIPIYSQKEISTVMLQLRGRGFEISESVTLIIRMGVSDILTSKGYQLVDENIQKKVIKEQVKQHTKGCYDNECLVDTGQMLAAKAIFSIEIVKLGKIYVFNLRYIDSEKGIVEKSISLTYESDLNSAKQLLEFSKKITKEGFKNINIKVKKEIKKDSLKVEKKEKLDDKKKVNKVKKGRVKYDPNYFINVDNKFLIGKYEVTQKEYKKIMGSNPSYFKGENNPVGGVSWYNAIKFCNKKSLKDGLEPVYIIDGRNKVKIDKTKNGYRLPYESEWEYAAEGGSLTRYYIYSGSNDLDKVSWHKRISNYKFQIVGIKKPNELGIYDMSGNVWEWCNDWYDVSNKLFKVLRGGSYEYRRNMHTISYRHCDELNSVKYDYGFRIVLPLK